jgi:hypothetical protein
MCLSKINLNVHNRGVQKNQKKINLNVHNRGVQKNQKTGKTGKKIAEKTKL